MSQTHETTIYAQRLILEYNRARKLLRKYFKKTRHEPIDARRKIEDVINNITRRQSNIIGNTLIASYKAGSIEGTKIAEGTLTADSAGFDLTKVSDTHLNQITKDSIGHIGKYNEALSKQLTLQYDTLLADNRLVNSLHSDGWTPWMDKALEARGVDPKVISLVKGQTTTAKMISILEMQGIRGGKHPREIAKQLLPHIQRYFGPEGVVINNVGKLHRVLEVDADGNYRWVQKKITKAYKATPKTYANLISRSSMVGANHEGRYQSLQQSGLVDSYISISILGPRTCARCAILHGRRVSHADGPLYHGNCMCSLKPVWKKDTGLKNKDFAYYENQRDQHFWNQHQLKEFNKTMPRGKKVKFYSILPKDAIKAMPDKDAMRAIRYEMLGKPAVIKPPGISKPKAVKVEDKLETLKREERVTANELWEKTSKDGLEHAKIVNDGVNHIRGNKSGFDFVPPKNDFIMHHTHPGWDSPLSGTDLGTFLETKQFKKNVASSSKRVYIAIKKKDTVIPKSTGKAISDEINELAQKITTENTEAKMLKTFTMPTKEEAQIIWHDAMDEANKIVAKKYNFDYISFTRK